MDTQTIEQPFPLKKLFRGRFLPFFLVFTVFFLAVVGFSGRRIAQFIYLEQAQRRAETVVRAVSGIAPDAWQHLLEGRSLDALKSADDVTKLMDAFQAETHELGITEMKVYHPDTTVLYATHANEIGTTESGATLLGVIQHNRPGLAIKELANKASQYELYVPVFDEKHNLRAIFELYEPVSRLDKLLLWSTGFSLLFPVLLLALLVFFLDRLVCRAQVSINARTDQVNSLRARLETFISRTAAQAARDGETGGKVPSAKVTTTVFFSDVRSFTSYCEQHTPEQVVDFLNYILGLQVDIVRKYGGDVDKMIGDAVMARFDGPDGGKHAIAASVEILQKIKQGELAHPVGIGVFRGEVISGAIGADDRRDYTIIGDTVNIASRLCSAAGEYELVADINLCDSRFNDAEELHVKGREAPVKVRRYCHT